MGLLRSLFGSGESSESAPHGVSAYDGKPNNVYRFNAERDGRQITVYSSWRPGDPDR